MSGSPESIKEAHGCCCRKQKVHQNEQYASVLLLHCQADHYDNVDFISLPSLIHVIHDYHFSFLIFSSFLNLQKLLISSRNLDFFTSGYRYLIQILPAAVVAPMYFSGKIEFGVINQSVSAFNHILGDVSLIIYQFQAISAFSAVIDRLGTDSFSHIFINAIHYFETG